MDITHILNVSHPHKKFGSNYTVNLVLKVSIERVFVGPRDQAVILHSKLSWTEHIIMITTRAYNDVDVRRF